MERINFAFQFSNKTLPVDFLNLLKSAKETNCRNAHNASRGGIYNSEN